MEKVGVIQSRTPFIDRDTNEQVIYQGKYGKRWRFNVTIDNIKGYADAASSDPAWKQGTKVTYDITSEPDKMTKFSIKLFKEQESQPVSTNGNKEQYKSKYNDPVIVKTSAIGMSQRIARLAYTYIPLLKPEMKNKPDSITNILEYAEFFYDWIIKDGINRDSCSPRWYALEEAVENMKFTSLNINNKDKIIETAEIILKQVKDKQI
jgi:hypothetical protein